MNESDLLENQLRSWIPRRPSAKVTARIFPEASQAAGGSLAMASHSELFRWLTPLAACFLTMLAITGGNVRRSSIPEADDASSYAIVMLDSAQSSNVSRQVYSLTKMNANVEWNVWPQVSFRPENLSPRTWLAAMTNK